MNIPEGAIEAAAEALCGLAGVGDYHRELGRVAVEAAIPHLREAIAQEIEESSTPGTRPEVALAARIVRG